MFCYENGIAEFVEHLNRNKDPLHSVVYFGGERDDTAVEVAMQYNDSFQENILTYANNIHTQEGGTHLSGFKTALTRVINNYARKSGALKEKDPNLAGDDVREGLAAVISVKIKNPQFEGQTKTKLGNGEVDGIVNSIVGEKFGEFLEEHPTARAPDHRQGADRAQSARCRPQGRGHGQAPERAGERVAARQACRLHRARSDEERDIPRRGTERRWQRQTGPRPAHPGHPAAAEARFINVEKARMDKALENEEIKSLVAALGTGITHSSMDLTEDESPELDFAEEAEAESDIGNGNGRW